ncbi:APC family, aromatic amino acid transporter [Salmonella enterica subsp. enterica]|nr:APC family, aromatic amino acid transporter [Salmonella enterica subsp. enterica]
MIINAINLTNVKVFGEMEFWFAIIKVIAVIAMILFGAWLLFSDTAGPQATVRNLWEQGRLSAAWLDRAGDDDGHYYVFFRRTGAGRDHRR